VLQIFSVKKQITKMHLKPLLLPSRLFHILTSSKGSNVLKFVYNFIDIDFYAFRKYTSQIIYYNDSCGQNLPKGCLTKYILMCFFLIISFKLAVWCMQNLPYLFSLINWVPEHDFGIILCIYSLTDEVYFWIFPIINKAVDDCLWTCLLECTCKCFPSMLVRLKLLGHGIYRYFFNSVGI
jgi:hypothetical protein